MIRNCGDNTVEEMISYLQFAVIWVDFRHSFSDGRKLFQLPHSRQRSFLGMDLEEVSLRLPNVCHALTMIQVERKRHARMYIHMS